MAVTLAYLEGAIRKFEQMHRDAIRNGEHQQASWLRQDIKFFKRLYRRLQKGVNLDE